MILNHMRLTAATGLLFQRPPWNQQSKIGPWVNFLDLGGQKTDHCWPIFGSELNPIKLGGSPIKQNHTKIQSVRIISRSEFRCNPFECIISCAFLPNWGFTQCRTGLKHRVGAINTSRWSPRGRRVLPMGVSTNFWRPEMILYLVANYPTNRFCGLVHPLVISVDDNCPHLLIPLKSPGFFDKNDSWDWTTK